MVADRANGVRPSPEEMRAKAEKMRREMERNSDANLFSGGGYYRRRSGRRH